MRPSYYPARSVLFHKEANGVTYRVPALLYLPRSNSFLAFCEERLSPSDAQAHLLVMRKGTFYRNYVEWEDMCVLGTAYLAGHRSMNPCPVYDEFTGTLFLFFIAVLGHTSEAYQLVTGKNVTRLCYVSSSDHGDTWGPVTDLTKRVIGDTIKDWATFALGPGHGIQLKSGRLLVPAYAYHINCKECFGQVCQTTPRAFCFHSDTHGRTWRFGEAVPGPESVECQMVSVDQEDGTNVLYCNARSPLGCRVQALSLDDGAVFQDGQLVQRLVEPRNGCHGSIVGFPAPIHLHHPRHHPQVHSPLPHTHSRHWTSSLAHPSHSKLAPFYNTTTNNTATILSNTIPTTMTANSSSSNSIQAFSTLTTTITTTITTTTATPAPTTTLTTTPISPNSRSPQNFLTPTWVVYSHPTWPNARKDLGVFLNLFPRDPDSWSGPWVIYEGPSAYSDLAYLELPPSPGAPPAVAFACLFECGTRTAYDEISFSIFTLYELIDNLPRNMPLGRDDLVDKGLQPYSTLQQEAKFTSVEQSSRHDAQSTTHLREVSQRREKRKMCGLCSVS